MERLIKSRSKINSARKERELSQEMLVHKCRESSAKKATQVFNHNLMMEDSINKQMQKFELIEQKRFEKIQKVRDDNVKKSKMRKELRLLKAQD